jgi:hypothetical protein
MLLLSPDMPTTGPPQLLWRLISGEKEDPESFEQAICRRIKHTTKLELTNIQLLSSATHKKGKHFYHGELTDKDVNSIERREGQRLEFFTLSELEKLTLTSATEGLLNEYRNTVEKLFARE